jgi:hypothetical protein
VSAAYATFIALAIAGAIGAILGLIYWTFLSSKSEPSSYEAPAPHDGYGFFKSKSLVAFIKNNNATWNTGESLIRKQWRNSELTV